MCGSRSPHVPGHRHFQSDDALEPPPARFLDWRTCLRLRAIAVEALEDQLTGWRVWRMTIFCQTLPAKPLQRLSSSVAAFVTSVSWKFST